VNGKLDPEERVMDSPSLLEDLALTIEKLKWEASDNIVVEVAGISIYEIEGAGTKWTPKKGTSKYNKDAFIVIKNLDRHSNSFFKPKSRFKTTS
jgi:hypothetical protein